MTIRKLRAGRVATATPTDYIGEYGTIFWDESLGTLKISDGVTPGGKYIIINAQDLNLTFGDFVASENNLSVINDNEDLNLITNGSGVINLVGKLHIHTTLQGINGDKVFEVDDTGHVIIRMPTIPLGDQGMLINGAVSDTYLEPQTPGTTLHVVGNNNVGNRILNDSFGMEGAVNASPAWINRYSRLDAFGDHSTVQTGDILCRFSSVGWGTTNFTVDTTSGAVRAPNTLEFVATENFTDTQGGSKFNVYVCPNGSTVKTLSASFDNTGVSAIQFNGNVLGTTGTLTNLIVNGNIRYNSAYNNAVASGFNKNGGTVTANGRTGQLTTNNDGIAKNATVTFTVNNNVITSAKDLVFVNIASGGSNNSYQISVTAVSASGSFKVSITNTDGNPLSEALVINFAVIKVE